MTLETTVGNEDIGEGSFNPEGQFVFSPKGSQSIVPTGATLNSGGTLMLDWSGYSDDITGVSINANYNYAYAYFELLKQGSDGSKTVVGTYTIDPVDNDPADHVQSAVPSALVSTSSNIPGTISGSTGSETVYTLPGGAAVPGTASFQLYEGSTLLGTGSFNSSGNMEFVRSSTQLAVPYEGSLGTSYLTGQGTLDLYWQKLPPCPPQST